MDDYALNLGKLVGNLHSLELSLRAFLVNRAPPTRAVDYGALTVGDVVAEDPFTNYDTLGTLIDKYNAAVLSIDPALQIPVSVVDVRDAIAHGRLSATKPEPPLTLLKFSRPKDGKVTVTHAETVDAVWLQARYREVVEYLHRVVAAHRLIT